MKYLQNLYKSIAENSLRAAILIGTVCLVTFGNTVLNDYNLDDNLVTQNHRLTSKGIKAIPEIYRSPYYEDDMGYSYGYRPTTLASFAIEHEIFGESARVSHTVNLILYLITCVLMYLLIRRIFPDKAGIALGAALLFTVHPIHTEVVASIKNRDEILSLLFAMLACFVLIRPKRFLPSLILGSALFFLSVSSKMSGVNFILLLAVIPVKRLSTVKDILILFAYFLILCWTLAERGTVNYQWEKIIVLIITFLCLRLITEGEHINKIHFLVWKLGKRSSCLFREIKKNAVSIWLVVIKCVPNYSSSRKLEILIATTCAVALLDLRYEYFMLYALAVIISFIVLPTNNLDAFFRFALLAIFLGEDDEYNLFLIAFSALFVLQRSKFTVLKYQSGAFLISILVSYAMQEYDWQSYVGIVSFQLGLMLFVAVSDKILTLKEFILFMFIVLAAATFGWFLNDINGLTDGILISTPVLLKLLSTNLKLKYDQIVPSEFKIFTHRVIMLSMIATLSFAFFKTSINSESSQLHCISATKAINFLLDGYVGNTETFNPSEIWSAKNISSWNRPFDYVEHPLSPFAPLGWKIGTAAVTVGRYTGKLFFPHPLAFYYGFDEVNVSYIFRWKPAILAITHLGFLIFGLLQLKRNPIIGVGIILYLFSIALFSGMAEMVAGMFSDRFSYVSSFGFCLAVVGILSPRFERLGWKGQGFFSILSFLIIVLMLAYSINRNAQWKNKLTLMRHDIENVPNSAQAHNLLAHTIMENVFKDDSVSGTELAKVQQASNHFKRATEIYPRFFNAWVDQGKVNMLLNNPKGAIYAFNQALSIDSGYLQILEWMGESYEQIGDWDNAVLYYEKVLKTNPNAPLNYNNLARALYNDKRYEEAIEVCQAYLKIDPNNKSFRQNIKNMNELLNKINQKEPPSN